MTTKISAMTAASAAAAANEFEINESGTTKKVTGTQIATMVQGLNKASAANAKDTTNTSTLLTPANLLDVGVSRLLFTLVGANMNTTADQQFTKVGTFSSYIIQLYPTLVNASTSLTTAAGGIYTAASKGGDQLVASSQAYTGASSSARGVSLILTGLGLGKRTETPYLSLTTAQGSTATADIYIFGIPLS